MFFCYLVSAADRRNSKIERLVGLFLAFWPLQARIKAEITGFLTDGRRTYSTFCKSRSYSSGHAAKAVSDRSGCGQAGKYNCFADATDICRNIGLQRLAHDNRGSAVVEASMVLPLFIMAMLFIFSLGCCFKTKAVIYEGLHETAVYLAEYSYLYDMAQQGADIDMPELVGDGISTATAKCKLMEYIDDTELVDRFVSGSMSGIAVTQADRDEDNYIYVKICYKLKVDIPLFGTYKMLCTEKIRQRAYLGCISDEDSESGDGKYVYVAENAQVYHTSRECYHISLSVRKGSVEQAVSKSEGKDQAAQKDGNKRTDCELCSRYKKNGSLYVTDDGSRYHYTLDCAGIKRTIYRVKKSDCSGLRPCSECAGGGG